MSQEILAVVVEDNLARIKVSGRATFGCSEDLKKFCHLMLEKKVEKIVIDMENCAGMDSTFMGILTMVSLSARKQNTVIEMNNTSEYNQQNLFSLGLKNMFDFTETATASSPEWENLEGKEISQEQHKENVLDAHQTLIDVHEENRKEFQDIITFLKESPE
ncbi:MAG: STAS domain-containing protein [Lentisphaeraceae bacterium]|nr:STAS domain-containing protein [Lentisphaeraceae bacterium]